MRAFSMVVAVDQSYGIGKSGTIPWNIPTDLKWFKEVTSKLKTPALPTPCGEKSTPATTGVLSPISNGTPTASAAAAGSTCESAAVSPTATTAKKWNAVIMGRKTWESIPKKYRPLANRINIIISTTLLISNPVEKVFTCTSLSAALQLLASPQHDLQTIVENVFIVGGSQIYAEALQKYSHLCHHIYLTKVHSTFGCDVYFPNVFEGVEQRSFDLVETSTMFTGSEKGVTFQFQKFTKLNWEEKQYLDLIQKIIQQGNRKEDRTGVGTLSIFGAQMRFSLRDNVLPLLTSKKVFFRGVAEELLWFIRGDTNAKHLQEKNVHIWDGNASREFLDSRGLASREVGDLGPVYGFQWRHFGATYKDMHTDYTGQGIDQLQEIIHTLRTNPNDRRMLLTAWNPAALADMALPPCHCLAQFYVFNQELSCQLYQRSCDMGLGVPFNIASYALFTHMMAHVTGLKPGELIHTLGDAHVYLNHVEPLQKQLTRNPKPFPTLTITKATKNIEEIKFEDLLVKDYDPLPTIKMEMAV